MTRHTPGPWTWNETDEQATHRELTREGVPVGEDDSILYHGADWPMEEANARLIAAAPDLLEALKAMLTTALKCDDMAWANAVDRAETSRPCDMAAAAIAKAEGQ